jgi:hypothetical protein
VTDHIPPRGDPATEWRRSQPDVVVYIPKGAPHNDTDNEHFLVFESPRAGLLAMWTQSSVEGRGDNHLVLARSADGVRWSAPEWIVGTHPGTDELQASWGFPIVTRRGRIYCFYTKELPIVDNNRQGCGAMGCAYSDDDGHNWTFGADIPMPRNQYDHPDPNVPRNWIVWQKPIRDRQGRWIAGYTQTTSKAVFTPVSTHWTDWDSRCAFMRFENIEDNPDPRDLRMTWLPTDRAGLEVPARNYPQFSVAQEPSLALLPDGRLFCVMRTMTGYIWYAVSADDGATWRDPEVLRYRDGGDPVPHPLSPGPVYAMGDGRYLLVYHNNPGRLGPFDMFKEKWEANQANFVRRPTFISVGEFRPRAHQPLWFSPPRQILDTDGIPLGPKNTAEIATYTSYTEYGGQRVLWYPDRKYYLLGRYITDEVLAGLECPSE